MYSPKGKYKKHKSGGNEFIYANSKKPFIGDYILLSTGRMFEGRNILSVKNGVEIIPIKPTKKDGTYIIKSNTFEARQYKLSKPVIFKDQDNYIPIIHTKPTPTAKDYEKGFFYRYFCQRRNSTTQYYEITKEAYKELSSGTKKYDSNAYAASKIKWNILDGAALANTKAIRRQKRIRNYPNLNLLFNDPREYSVLFETLSPKAPLEDTPYNKLLPETRTEVKKAQKKLMGDLKERGGKSKINKQNQIYKSLIKKSSRGSSSTSGGGGGGY